MPQQLCSPGGCLALPQRTISHSSGSYATQQLTKMENLTVGSHCYHDKPRICFTRSTSALKLNGSVMASSDKLLRFKPMLSVPNPFMNWL